MHKYTLLLFTMLLSLSYGCSDDARVDDRPTSPKDDAQVRGEIDGGTITDAMSSSLCGDGIISGSEGCDDGNTDTERCDYGVESCTVCAADCTEQDGKVRFCGDGVLDEEETCDDGNQATETCDYGVAGCTVCADDCTEQAGETRVCGDGVKDPEEFCDDGNRDTEACPYGNTDCIICDANCQEVSGSIRRCGDGRQDPEEACDDGNTVTESCPYGQAACSVCAEDCTLQEGAVRRCGDGIKDPEEFCDDGNLVTEDCPYGEVDCTVCDTTCTLRPGYSRICGDGRTDPEEGCDDGNTLTETCGYGQQGCTICAADCTQQPGALRLCGDGALDLEEGCDDGNTETEACAYGETECTVCSATCTEVSGVTAYCGDGLVTHDETCDDENAITEVCPYDAESCQVCDANCQTVAGQRTFCGDGIINGEEICDEGPDPSPYCAYGEASCTVCQPDCTTTDGVRLFCGDGLVTTPNEDCDDGNLDSTDRCAHDCTALSPAFCGQACDENGTVATLTLIQTLNDSELTPIALEADMFLATQPVNDTQNTVVLFERSPTGEWLETQRFEPIDDGNFGDSAAFAGHLVVVGSPRIRPFETPEDSFDEGGAVHIYERNNANEWHHSSIQALPGQLEFGRKVSATDNLIAFTLSENRFIRTGDVAIWEKTYEQGWSEAARYEETTSTAALHASENRIIIGRPKTFYQSPLNSWSDAYKGAISVIEKQIDGTWHEATLTQSGYAGFYASQLGVDVDSDGNIIAAASEDEASTFVFEKDIDGSFNEIILSYPSTGSISEHRIGLWGDHLLTCIRARSAYHVNVFERQQLGKWLKITPSWVHDREIANEQAFSFESCPLIENNTILAVGRFEGDAERQMVTLTLTSQCKSDGGCVCKEGADGIDCNTRTLCGDGELQASESCEPNDDNPLSICTDRCEQAPLDCSLMSCVRECDTDEDCPNQWSACLANVCAPVDCRTDIQCGAPDSFYAVPGQFEKCFDNTCATCREDSDCNDEYCSNGSCFPCVTNAHCRAESEGGRKIICAGDWRGCVECLDNDDCPLGVCNDDNECVECTEDAHCGDGVCRFERCKECRTDDDCPANLGCYSGVCGCNDDSQCPTGVCSDSNECVECTESADCPEDRSLGQLVCYENTCQRGRDFCNDDSDCFAYDERGRPISCQNTMCLVRPPATCDTARPLTLGSEVHGYTTGVSNHEPITPSGFPSCGSRLGTGPEDIFEFTSPIDGTVCFDTSGTSFDTIVYIRRLEACEDDSFLVCDDDAGVGAAGLVTAELTAGETYAVFVDGYNEYRSGKFVLKSFWGRNGSCTRGTTLCGNSTECAFNELCLDINGTEVVDGVGLCELLICTTDQHCGGDMCVQNSCGPN